MSKEQRDAIIQVLRERGKHLPKSIEGLREDFETYCAMLPRDNGVHRKHVFAGGVPGEWFLPQDAVDGRVLLYLHGGGYAIGSTESHAGLIGEIAKACRARTLAINYRLAPEHPFPAAVEDAVAAYEWLLQERTEPGGLLVAGDSAGGGLVLSLLVALRDAGRPLPAGAICISPWTDLAATGESMETRGRIDPMLRPQGVRIFAHLYCGHGDLKTPLASPLYADLRGLPPLLLHVGDWEILLDDATRLAARAREAGVDVTLTVYPEMLHVWHLFHGILDEGREAIAEIATWAEGTLAGSARA